jgi:hypothetical protein
MAPDQPVLVVVRDPGRDSLPHFLGPSDRLECRGRTANELPPHGLRRAIRPCERRCRRRLDSRLPRDRWLQARPGRRFERSAWKRGAAPLVARVERRAACRAIGKPPAMLDGRTGLIVSFARRELRYSRPT